MDSIGKVEFNNISNADNLVKFRKDFTGHLDDTANSILSKHNRELLHKAYSIIYNQDVLKNLYTDLEVQIELYEESNESSRLSCIFSIKTLTDEIELVMEKINQNQ
ncbi:MAG: hypothetical protein HN687_03680 [Candidatus Marinimicrobia bacterium]|jgi:hypothetical protein|nr:hypothetical protein [Candidatus Neomarinimicrobiota bacterium]MBT5068615.1 hypothetical protein [Candidatus Neomarinimicrobiota bacterium]MBT7973235.1 hypothetical protein [Candidatus Neomarinimicrobiota bacterium]